MTRLLRPWPIALLSALAAGMSAPAPAATVKGYVLDVLRDERVPGVEVAFLIPDQGGGVTEIARRTTDKTGGFSFAAPFLSAGTPFVLTAYYRDLEYGTRNLVVGNQDQVILEVYEGIDDPSGIHVAAHHLFLSVRDRGLEVLQLVQAENHGSATYVGRRVGEERRVLELALPEGHLGLQAHAGAIVRAGPTRAFDSRPLPPGSTQTAFTFQLPAAALEGHGYEHTVIYPTDRLELFLQPPEISLGAPFQDLGRITIQDRDYRHYRLEGLDPGRTVAVPLPVPRPLRWALKWAMIALVPAVLITVFALARTTTGPAERPAPTGEDRELLEQRRWELLAELSRLHSAGDPPQGLNSQTRPRQLVMAEAVEVYRRLGLDAEGD